MKYFSKAGNVKTKISRVYADLTQGLCMPQNQKKNSALDMMNFSSDKYPWLASRRRLRVRYYAQDYSQGVGAYNATIYYVKDGMFYYGGVEKFEVSEGKKTFYDYNGKIIIFPDMIHYDPNTGKHGKFGVATEEITYKISNRVVGTVNFGLASIHSEDVKLTDYFTVGDGIKITDEEGLGISGFHTITAVNKIYGVLFFDKFEFGDGQGFTLTGKISNGGPEKCDAGCVCGGRVWVVAGNKIHASTINDECNWAVGGDDEKSSFVCDFDNGDTITACIELEGNPVFFSEKKIYKVYGDRASNFHLKCCSNWGGIPKNMSRTVAVLKDKIFYVSEHGVTCFNGSTPKILEHITFSADTEVYAAAGGQRYYAFIDNGDVFFYVYDDMSNQWHKYGEHEVSNFFTYKGALYACTKQGIHELWGESDLLKPYNIEVPTEVFADFLFDVGGGRPLRVGIDVDCRDDVDCEIYISYDAEGERKLIKAIKGEFLGIIEIPLVPKDCQRLTVGLVGEGDITIKELYVEFIG